MTQIFLSYSQEDETRVSPLVEALEAQGWTVFWDRRIPTGQTWRSHIGNALSEAECVIVAWSQESVESRWVTEEADEGLKRGILVPVLIDAVEPPIGFRSIQAADLTNWRQGQQSPSFTQLLSDIASKLNEPSENGVKPREAPPKQRPRPSGRAAVTIAAAVVLLVAAVVAYVYLESIGTGPLTGDRPMDTERLRDVIPMAGGFDQERWAKQLGSGTSEIIAGDLQVRTHRGPVLMVANGTNINRDFGYSVRADVVSGPTQLGFGLAFGIVDDGRFFLFAKRNAKEYRLTEMIGNREKVIVPWTASALIRDIRHAQKLQVVTEGSFVTLLADGKELKQARLQREPFGRVGVFAESPGLTVNFSELSFGPLR